MALFYEDQTPSSNLDTLKQALKKLETFYQKLQEREDLKYLSECAHNAHLIFNEIMWHFADMFRDPEAAWAHFQNLYHQYGLQALQKFQLDPEAASPLKGWSAGFLQSTTRRSILKLSLPRAMKTVERALSYHAKAGGGAFTREVLQERDNALNLQYQKMLENTKDTSDRLSLETHIALIAYHLPEGELAHLEPPHLKLVNELMKKCAVNIQDELSRLSARRASEKKIADEVALMGPIPSTS